MYRVDASPFCGVSPADDVAAFLEALGSVS
jgi:hypothetical protein